MKRKPFYRQLSSILSMSIGLAYFGGGLFLVASSATFGMLPSGLIRYLFGECWLCMVDIDFIVDMFSTKMKMFKASLFILSVLWAVSCKRPEDSTSHGRVTITADESLQPMLDQVYQAYEHTFPETHFDVRYLPEHQAAAFMLKDSARLAFVTREFTSEEQKVFKSKGIKYNPQHIATDGVALLINRSNPDTLITLEQISGVFKGTVKTWGQLGSANRAEDIVLVFDNANSSNLNFIMKNLTCRM